VRENQELTLSHGDVTHCQEERGGREGGTAAAASAAAAAAK